MARFVWFGFGVAAGFVVAHEVSKTESGKKFFATVDTKAKEFGSAVSKGFQDRDSQLRSALDQAKSKLDEFVESSD